MKLAQTFLSTDQFFTLEEVEKIKSLQTQCDALARHHYRFYPLYAEAAYEQAQSAYTNSPTKENLTKVIAAYESVLIAARRVHPVPRIIDGVILSHLKENCLPFLLNLVARLDERVGKFLDGFIAEKKKESVGDLGDESGAVGYIVSCHEIRRRLKLLPISVKCGCENASGSVRICMSEVTAIGFDLKIMEALGEPDPLPETANDLADKSFKERRDKAAADAAKRLEDEAATAKAKREAALAKEAAAGNVVVAPGATQTVVVAPPATGEAEVKDTQNKALAFFLTRNPQQLQHFLTVNAIPFPEGATVEQMAHLAAGLPFPTNAAPTQQPATPPPAEQPPAVAPMSAKKPETPPVAEGK